MTRLLLAEDDLHHHENDRACGAQTERLANAVYRVDATSVKPTGRSGDCLTSAMEEYPILSVTGGSFNTVRRGHTPRGIPRIDSLKTLQGKPGPTDVRK